MVKSHSTVATRRCCSSCLEVSTFRSDLTHEVESEHRSSSTANVTTLKADSQSSALDHQQPSGRDSTKKNLNDEPKPKAFDTESERISNKALEVMSPASRASREIMPRPAVSGSDIDYALHRQYSSISSFFEQVICMFALVIV